MFSTLEYDNNKYYQRRRDWDPDAKIHSAAAYEKYAVPIHAASQQNKHVFGHAGNPDGWHATVQRAVGWKHRRRIH